MSTEALKARNMYPEAAVEYIKLTHEVNFYQEDMLTVTVTI